MNSRFATSCVCVERLKVDRGSMYRRDTKEYEVWARSLRLACVPARFRVALCQKHLGLDIAPGEAGALFDFCTRARGSPQF